MKFRDGYWHLKNNVKLSNPREIRDMKITVDSLTIYSSCVKINHRGDTLNAPVLTTEFTSPMPDVIRVRSVHHKGALNRPPFFEVLPDSDKHVAAEVQTSGASFSSGDMRADIRSGESWAVDFTYKGRPLTGISGKHSGHIKKDDGSVFMSEHLGLSVGENVYGLGERFTSFVKNGQVVDIWNEDGGTSSEQAYKNIPFYMTSKGYGVLVNNPGKVSFEVASEVVTSVQFSVPGEFLDYYIIGGGSPREVLRNYTSLTGKPALPPAWSFGLWLTTSFTTDYNEETVTRFIDGMAERNIPLHVFHFDCFWMKEFQWVDFEWDKDQFPEPEAMLERLKAKGLHISVWINPYIAQKSRLFDEGQSQGFLVKNPDGSIWQWDRWQAGMGLVDFTNPGAVVWFRNVLKKLIRMGVDTFKTDFGERIPVDVVYHDGSDPVKMHNFYTYLYNKTVFELLEEEKGKHQALLFARSATVGGQKFPVHWGGDCSASYESMAETMRGGLSLALSGFGFWSHDISGFEMTATPDLYKRWIAYGSLSSHSRLHGNESYRVPWNFDDESSDVLRYFTSLKCSLMPYIFSRAVVTSKEGIPVMRPMFLEFPDDPACSFLDRQYMLGDALLVAPVFSDDSMVSYFLPEGSWTNFITGEKVSGGCWRREEHDYMSLPLMVKPGSVIAVGAEDSEPDYDFADNVCFHLFEIADNSAVSETLYSADAAVSREFSVRREGSQIVAECMGSDKPWNICLRGIYKAETISGGVVSEDRKGLMISARPGSERITIILTEAE